MMTKQPIIRWAGQGLLGVAALLASAISQAAGLLQPSDATLPPLQIRDHEVSVVIEENYAVTTVEQVFYNPNDRDLEARYSFPVPQHGSVAEFTLWIDGQPVTGEVMERQAARQAYEEEKAAGRDAGLTEKDRYKTFEVMVSPVRAGQETRVRLVYLQAAQVDTGIGRYVYPLEEGGVDEEKMAFWTANERVERHFSFDMKLRSAYPIEAVRLPNQPQAQVTQVGTGDWQIHLGDAAGGDAGGSLKATAGEGAQPPTPSATPAFTLDKDLVVYWRHQAGLPGSVDLIAHKTAGEKRGTFMLVVTPGDDLQPITGGRDWIFVLDVSGSMQGKFATLADGVGRALKQMRPEDRFRIVLFNNRSWELTQGFVNATADNLTRYVSEVASVTPSDGTNLFAGLENGLSSLDADRTSALVLVTDGVANVGETHQRQFIELIRKRDIRLFTFIMGNSANTPLLEAVTKASNGFALSLSNSDDVVGQLLTATAKVSHQALHGVELKIDGVKTADLTPTEIGSLYRGQQLVLFGHYWGDGEAEVTLKGRISGQEKVYRSRFAFPSTATDNPEIERLWAYAAIEEAMGEIENFGEKPDIKQAITDLGVEYGLVTDYTSMVVMRDEMFDQRGIQRNNRQRIAVEEAARQQRASQPPVPRQADSRQPMFSGVSRPHFGGGHGGGALDGWTLLLFLPLLWLSLGRRKRGGL